MRRLDKVSVVVCNYNGEEHLPACLESVRTLGARVDEVLVVDNASTDGSLALIRSNFPEVEVITLERNGGPCVARNLGMVRARNRWVLALDNDAAPRADALDGLAEALEAHEDAVAAQTRNVFFAEPTRVHYDGADFHYVGLLSLRNFYCPLAEATGEGVLPASGLIAVAILLDRDRVLECGGYDESFFILFEDYDLAMRLRIAGHALLQVEDAICLHRGGTAGVSFRGGGYPRSRAFYHSRNRWILMVKNYCWRTLLVALPGILVYEAVWALFTLRERHFLANLAGKLSFLLNLPETLRSRRMVQEKRAVRDRDLLVSGPLTFSPELMGKPLARRIARGLDCVLSAWWRLARGLSA